MTAKQPDPYKLDAGAAVPDTQPAGGMVRPRDRDPDPYGVAGGDDGEGETAAPAAEKADAPSEPSAAGGGRFTSQLLGGVHVISLNQSNVIDGRDIERLGDEIYHFIKTMEAPRVVIDLEQVQHLSSAALGTLIALKQAIDKRDGKICLANVSPDLRKIFKLTKLNKVLKIYGDADKAIKSLI